jgi:hypothetical protein
MSFFELDGGKAKKAKPKAKKSTKPKATAKKASSGKKKTKKGGNFLGTVSELFAPAGWESFVTAAGLLALDRTDNFLRKKKDSKKQKGGSEYVNMEENEMTGGARKRSSSRKQRGGEEVKTEEEMTGGARKRRTQRGGSDGHLPLTEHLDGVDGEDNNDVAQYDDAMSQNGGAKKKAAKKKAAKKKAAKKVKGRKHRGGAMTEDQQNELYQAYVSSPSPNKNKNSQNANAYNTFITGLLTQLGVEVNDTNKQEAKLVIDYKKKSALPNGNQSKANAKSRLNAFYTSQSSPLAQATNSLFGNNTVSSTSAQSNGVSSNAMSSNAMSSNSSLQFPMNLTPTTGQNGMALTPTTVQNGTASLGGGKKAKSKSKSKSKAKPKTKKAPKRK